MWQPIVFTLTAIVLYLAADRILDFVERRRGERLPQRGVVFFVILLVLALVTFSVLQRVLPH